MKLEPVILQNLPIAGDTIIEKLEANIDVRYACVLLTPDDEGYPADIAPEGASGLMSRLTAIEREHGVTGALPFALRSDCPALTAADALSKLTALVEEAGQHLKDTFDLPITLMFVTR
jgi:hypothetical protein